MSNLFTVAHVAKLHEIQSARLRRNQPGIGRDVEQLIRRLESGGLLQEHMDERTRQAKVLWDLGLGSELGYAKFEDYLATIPEVIPHNDHYELFNRLVLVDRRPGIVKLAGMLGVEHRDSIHVSRDFHDRNYEFVEFVWCQDGRRNRDKSVRACRESFVRGVEIGMTVIEGLCLFAQDRSSVGGPDYHVIDLVGSVDVSGHGDAACLLCGGFRPAIIRVGRDIVDPRYGSASRRA